MIDRLRRHFTYANVMATLAVFIALGGSSYAALNITGRDIKDGSLTHRDLKRNTLGGTKIKESRLGKVRRARNAKRVLREAMRGVLPERILARPKMGFPVPFAQWMRGSWQHVAEDVLLDRRTRERGLFNAPAVAALLAAHGQGLRNGGDAIWALLNLELWYRTFIDGSGVQTLPAPHRPTTAPAAYQHAAPPVAARIASQRTQG